MKAGENSLLLRVRHTNAGVSDAAIEPDKVICQRSCADANHHFTLFGKFNRVAGQIKQYLF